MATYTRRNAWELETEDPGNVWDPYTLAYAKAVVEMRSRADDDPTSWTYQAAMHGTYTTPPAGATWNQCQHGSWYFLPWHRMYCYWFERIVRSIVIAQGGPDDWSLPYWNYSASTQQAAMPPAFRLPTWNPDGQGEQPNPLYTTHRAQKYNDGDPLPPSVVSLEALTATNFSGPPLPGFGSVPTGWSHEPHVFGRLENIPHNQVHVQIGGNEQDPCVGGWMVDPNCAAEDPIFWLHHSNIDRLWSVWNDAGGANPDRVKAWTGYVFHFWDENGDPQTMTPGDVSSLSQLDYVYEPTAAEEGARMAAPTGRAAGGSGDAVDPGAARRNAPRLVAASENEVELTGGRTDVTVPVGGGGNDRLRAVADPADASAQHVYLNVEGLTAEHTPGTSWEVHLNLPADAPGGGGDRLVGLVSFFGFRRQLDADSHGLGPMVHTFDITDLVSGLRDRGEWDELAATVSFVPVGGDDVAEGGAVHGRPRVGRVSISTQ
ncbi:MAG TPA: tyrosinase family protein [Frankiaceae bacterium]|nr:tyrosinase family protein [Frankiaceae bacterium]